MASAAIRCHGTIELCDSGHRGANAEGHLVADQTLTRASDGRLVGVVARAGSATTERPSLRVARPQMSTRQIDPEHFGLAALGPAPRRSIICARCSCSLWAGEEQSTLDYLLTPARMDFRPLAHGPRGAILVVYQSGGGPTRLGTEVTGGLAYDLFDLQRRRVSSPRQASGGSASGCSSAVTGAIVRGTVSRSTQGRSA